MNIPAVSFSEDKNAYETLAEKYRTHDKGLFILAPSGVGKTYFCKNQTEQHWIDGDELWMATKAHPDGPWWLESEETIHRVDQRSDVITMEAKLLGFWIMGASNFWLKPNAIVIPDWETHVAYIKSREENNYDGGATSERLDQVKRHIAEIEKWNTNFGVPSFKSVDEAVASLINN